MSDVVRIEWDGLNEFVSLIERIDDFLMNVVMQEYRTYGLLLEQGAKALAPEDSGDLASSINMTVRKSGDSVIMEVGSNLAYALRRHEEPYRYGVYPKYDRGSKFPNYYVNGRGATTRAKGAWRGYPAGRKYLENAVKATEDVYQQMLDRIIQRALNGGH